MGNMATENAAGNRIEQLLDAGSFVEIGGAVTARTTDFNMQEKKTPADGVITGYGVIDGNLVYVYSQDASVLKGSIGEMHARKIANIYDMAMKMGAPVIGLVDCAGLRLQEATDALGGIWNIIFKTITCIRSNSTDYSNFRNLWRRLVLSTSSYRFYIYGRKECEVIRKFSECDSRKYSR